MELNKFAYRCARLQCYMKVYLKPKNIQYLVASNISHSKISEYHMALFNYLFNFKKAGIELYDTITQLSDIIVVISQDHFHWYTESLESVKQLEQQIQGLSNHFLYCANISEVLTSSSKFKLNLGKYVSEQDYGNEIAQYKMDVATKTDSNVQKAIIYDIKNDNTQLDFLNKVISGENVAVAGPLTEEESTVNMLKDARKVMPVHQSLLQLVYSHIDAAALTPLIEASGQLKRQYYEIINQIQNAEQISAQLYQFVPESTVEQELPKKSAVKFNPTLNQNKEQIGHNGVYDIYLAHPRIPIVYRQPYIFEDSGLKLFQLIGFISCFMQDALLYLAELLQHEEGKVADMFKDYLKIHLLKDQPVEYVESIMQLIQGLKLNAEQYQLDGQKLFGRYVTNIQIACQLKFKKSDNDFEAQTLLFGRSYLSIHNHFISISDCGDFNKGLFKVSERINVAVSSLQSNLVINASSKQIQMKLGMMINNNGVGEMIPLKNDFQSYAEFQGFRLLLSVPYMSRLQIILKNKINSKKYSQIESISIEALQDENKMMPSFYRKKLFLCSNNLGLLLSQFGNYIFGYVCSEFAKYKTQMQTAELEGYFIEIDPLNSVNYNYMNEFINNLMADDIQQQNLKEYKYIKFNTEEKEEPKQDINVKSESEIEKSQKIMVENDMHYIFGQISEMDYTDKLLEKVQIKVFAQSKFEHTQLFLLTHTQNNDSSLLQQNAMLRAISNKLYRKPLKYVEISEEKDKVEVEKELQDMQENGNIIIVCIDYLSQQILQLASQFCRAFCCVHLDSVDNCLNIYPLDDTQNFCPINRSVTDFVIQSQKSECFKVVSPAFYEVPLEDDVYSQRCIDPEALIQAVNELKPRPFSEVNVNQFLGAMQAKPGLEKVGESDEVRFEKQPTLRSLTKLFAQNSSVFAGFCMGRVQLQFNKFVLDVFGNKVTCELNPKSIFGGFVLNKVVLLGYCLSEQQRKQLVPGFRSFILFLQAQFCPQVQEPTTQVQEEKARFDWETVQKYYENEPLPQGWFSDYGRFINWSGETLYERPDKEELIERYKKEVLKE